MKDRTTTYGRKALASLLAVLVVASVFGPIGTVAAVPGVSVSHANSQTTVQPGDTITITATFEQTEANSPAMEPQVPDGWTVTAATAGTDWSWVSQQQTFLGGLALSDSDGVSGTYTHTYTVQVPSDASPGDYTVTSEGSVVEPATSDRLVATASTTVTVEDTSNTPPTIDAISDQTVTEGDSATVSVSASDDDGDSVSLSLSQSPGFVGLSNGEITVAPESGDAGTYTVEVTADDGTDQTTESFQVTVEAPSTGDDVVFAVNAGGSEYTATDGTTFVADANFDGGQTFTSGSAGTPSEPEIANTDDDQLYWTERYGDFGYDIPVSESGQYEVTLYFAELYQGVANNGGEGDRVFDVSAEGQPVLDGYDIIAESGGPHTAITETATVEVTDGTLNLDFATVEDNAKISAIKVEKVGDVTPPETSASVAVNQGAGVDASTYGGGSYQVTNTGETDIQTLTLDLSETMLPDMVFDPYNTAGDDVGKEFTLDGGDVSVQNVEYTNFHNGQDNEAGYDTMVVTLSGFEPGETMSFSVDNDPTSIDTTDLGSQAAGPVSGLEITGATVSIDSGSGPIEATVVGDGSAGGSTATVTADEDESKPSIGVQGVSLSGTTLSDRHSAATVGDAQQTITISGAPANAEVTLLRVEGELNLNNVPVGYDIEEYEANKAMNVQYYTATTDSNGEATVDVTLTDANEVEESGLNYFTAWVVEPDGDTGPISDYAVLELEPNAAPTIDAIADQTVTEGGSATVSVSADDPDGDSVSLSLANAPDFVSLANGDLTISPTDGDAANSPYTVEVVADDGTTTTTASFQITVEEADAGPGPVGDFPDAPTDPDGDGVYEDVNGDGNVDVLDAQAIFANTQDPAVQNNVAAFDFNDDGSVNTLDAQALFANGVEA
jgi:hypothetical protein